MRPLLDEPDMVGLLKEPVRAPKRNNALLEVVRGAERDRIFSELEWVPLKLGEVLCEAGQPFSHAYFPIDAIISILYVMHNAESAEIAIIGREGMIGVPLFMGGDSTSSRAIVQNAGFAYRLTAQQLKDEFARGGMFQMILLRFAQALITQMVQTAACNRHHSLDQQLCRWLLMSLDRLKSSQLNMTQKLIGNMLGISGAGVKAAAAVLQKAGLIDYDKGNITILDRAGILRRSCECYGVVKAECERLFSAAPNIAEARGVRVSS
ncbi:MAG: Crp/Fnr family transcriptional regulator [Gammaproteobacteria bacterium]